MNTAQQKGLASAGDAVSHCWGMAANNFILNAYVGINAGAWRSGASVCGSNSRNGLHSKCAHTAGLSGAREPQEPHEQMSVTTRPRSAARCDDSDRAAFAAWGDHMNQDKTGPFAVRLGSRIEHSENKTIKQSSGERMIPNQSVWLTPTEAAKYLKVKSRTVLLWIRQGKLRAYALSGVKRRVWRLRREDLDAAMVSSSVLPSTPLSVRSEGRSILKERHG